MSFVGACFLLFVSVVTAAERTLQNSCPSGVLKTVDPYYLQVQNGSCFQFVKNKMRTYGDASADCRKYGGTLALPKTQSLNDYLIVQSVKRYRMLSPIWIGLHDLRKEKEFVWEDNTAMEWNNFAKGNGPDNNIFRRGLEDCVAIDPYDDGLWHDFQCNTGFIASVTFSSPKKMYICQYTIDLVDDKGDLNLKKGDQKNNSQQDNGHQVKDQQDKDQQDKDQQDKDQQDKDQQDKDQQDKDQQDKDQQDKDQQDKDQQDKDQQDKDQQDKDQQDKDQQVKDTPDKDQQDRDQPVLNDNGCQTFNCDKDCGMSGYKRDGKDCQICECN
ncbi:hypothetical protein RRG08_034846 [Elysia crispata]|uniref:C-type lectin domain-containing protein n=1 Tax=Elysia crispata TaxID=231223 RepID=A0AAE1AMH0_9GAST|nr:hypothetical protein RRG08_034846 [Elysia crispata]